MSSSRDNFPDSVEGLPEAGRPEIVELADGDTFDLRIAPVAKRLGEHTVRMLGYNGSIPGPTLRIREGSEIEVRIENQGDLADTVHWHGLRLENRYDGTHETQRPLEPGETFVARIRCPDAGVYWYHPHVREDYGQEMGLYGNLLVEPAAPNYWPPVHREVLITLDDVLLEDGRIAPFSPAETTHAAMGRFGEVLLIGGETDLRLEAEHREVVRFFLTNTANTRVFRVAIPGTRMKHVGGDSGRVEHEELVEDVVLGPSERAAVDVLFEEPGDFVLEHRTPRRTHELARIMVAESNAVPNLEDAFSVLRTNEDMAAERERVRPYLEADPDKVVAFLAEMDMDRGDGHHQPDPGEAAHDHGDTQSAGIEWEDDMPEMNRMTTPANMHWKIIDRETSAENQDIDWHLRVGDQVKIRLVNEMGGDHPMHHPFHVHGAGRFLVLARDGEPEPNLVWKDTVLVRAGQTVDILLEVTNPGRWMAHCHIAEHHESGMMFSFDVRASEAS